MQYERYGRVILSHSLQVLNVSPYIIQHSGKPLGIGALGPKESRRKGEDTPIPFSVTFSTFMVSCGCNCNVIDGAS